jgi:hypothetical protein
MSMTWHASTNVSEGGTTPGAQITALPWDGTYALFISDPNGGIYGIKAIPGFGWEYVPGITTTPGAPVTAIVTDNQFTLFVANANGEIFTNTGAPYAGWSGWVTVSQGSTKPGGHVAAVPWDTALALFIADPNGGVYGIKAIPGYGWEYVPGITTTPGAPVTVLSKGNQFVLFVADSSGEVFTNTGAPYTGWSGWASVSQGSTTPGGHIAAVPWGDTYALFIADPSGGIYGIKAIPGFGWENVPGITTTPGAPVTALAWFPPQSSDPDFIDSPVLLFTTQLNGQILSTSGLPYQTWLPSSTVGTSVAAPGAIVTVASTFAGISPYSVFFTSPSGEVFESTSVVSTLGGSNIILIDHCNNLSNLTVQMLVTEDLATVGDVGFSIQLNSYPQKGAITPNATPETTCSGSVVGQLYWFQYVMIVANNTITFEIQYWASGQSYQNPGPNNVPPQILWTPGFTPIPANTHPWLPIFPNASIGGVIVDSTTSNKIPAGSVITIQLPTDSSANITGATFSITDPDGNVRSASTQPWSHYAGQTVPSNYALYPIYGFQMNIVSAPGAVSPVPFMSGAGILTYSVSTGNLSAQIINTCGASPSKCGVDPVIDNPSQWPTGENSNVIYQEGFWPTSGATVRQSFATPPAS